MPFPFVVLLAAMTGVLHAHGEASPESQGAQRQAEVAAADLFSGALAAITAAVVGVILNLSILLGLHVLFRQVRQVATWPALGLDLTWPVWASIDPLFILLFVMSAFLLFRMKLA